jgi:hypothetical protein
MIGKAHQREIREMKEKEICDQLTFLEAPESPSLKNAVIKRIDFLTASTLILEYEWIGTMPLPKSCRFIYGIYFEGVLGGVVIFVEPSTRKFNKLYPRRVVQLNRGAVAHWTPKNTASRLIGGAIKELKKNDVLAIIAYCTPEAGEVGTIYQACNFIYTGKTQPSNSYYLDGHWVSGRTLADKISWAKNKNSMWLDKFNSLPTRKMQGKFRYVLPIGSNLENKRFMTDNNYISMPYPKRMERDEN